MNHCFNKKKNYHYLWMLWSKGGKEGERDKRMMPCLARSSNKVRFSSFSFLSMVPFTNNVGTINNDNKLLNCQDNDNKL